MISWLICTDQTQLHRPPSIQWAWQQRDLTKRGVWDREGSGKAGGERVRSSTAAHRWRQDRHTRPEQTTCTSNVWMVWMDGCIFWGVINHSRYIKDICIQIDISMIRLLYFHLHLTLESSRDDWQSSSPWHGPPLSSAVPLGAPIALDFTMASFLFYSWDCLEDQCWILVGSHKEMQYCTEYADSIYCLLIQMFWFGNKKAINKTFAIVCFLRMIQEKEVSKMI